VTKVHLLSSLTARFAESPDAAAEARKIAYNLPSREPFDGTITIDSEVEALIAGCDSREAISELFQNLVRELLSDEPKVPSKAPAKKMPVKKAPVKAISSSRRAAQPIKKSSARVPAKKAVVPKIPVPQESFETVMNDLNSMIGLDSVKERISQVFAMHRVNQKRVANGLPAVEVSHHLVFTGDPGTGKTTVARIVARLYKAIGLLPTGNFVEAGREDLVAAYVGQTAIKTQEVINRAMGGILFIDEAYSLSNKKESNVDFGKEAVSTLLKAMEDNRDKFVVIVAGYTKEMASFIGSNPGLKSRFTTTIEFKNYSHNELLSVFRGLCEKNKIQISEEVLNKILDHFTNTNTGGDAGNARYARSLFEMMFANLALRAASGERISSTEISSFEIEDLPNFNDANVQQTIRNPFGFVPQ
jgi:SpoVK/Ycf46/Vps4 family AAA+-type ATPase